MTDITFAIHRPYGAVLVTLEIYDDDGLLVCGLRHLEGRIDLPLSQRRAAFRQDLKFIEDEARRAGAHEMRHAGPNYARLLADYEPLPGFPNGLRKRL